MNDNTAPNEPMSLLGSADVPRTYLVRTLGCQMNQHDSERIAGLLEDSGLVPVESVPSAMMRATDAGDGGADVVVVNTCSVRENAANRLFGNLGQLASVKRERPGMQIAVGGCLAQQMRDGIVERAPWVDAVFGTHNLDVLPALLRRSEHNQAAAVEIEESLKVFPSTLPSVRESAYAAWVSISVGCNNTCTFCIVPRLRGRERDRLPTEVLDEVALAAEGRARVDRAGDLGTDFFVVAVALLGAELLDEHEDVVDVDLDLLDELDLEHDVLVDDFSVAVTIARELIA